MAIEDNIILKALLRTCPFVQGIWAVVHETHATEEIYQDVIVKPREPIKNQR